MGLFGKRDDVPETIGNEEYAKLQHRARKADKEPMFGRRSVERRLASNEQQEKRHLS